MGTRTTPLAPRVPGAITARTEGFDPFKPMISGIETEAEMGHGSRTLKGWSAVWTVAFLLPTTARAGDVYYHQTVGGLTFTQGELPQGAESRPGASLSGGRYEPLPAG